jgi:O-antigen/teichoic acid export membrane protein
MLLRIRRVLAKRSPKFVRDLVVLVGGQFASKLIGLAAFAVLARRLDPQGYGMVEYVVGVAALFAMAVDCGLGMIGVRRIARSPSELPLLAAQIPLARLAIASLAIPVMVASVEMLGPPGMLSGLVWLFAASLLFAAWNQEWLLQSAELMTHVAITQALRMLTFTTMVVLLVHHPSDIVAVGWAEIAAAAVACLCYLGLQHLKVTPVRFSFSPRSMVALVREGTALGLSQFVWVAAQFLPLFLVGSIVGGAVIGWFAAAQRLVTSLSTFSNVYHFNLFAAVARASAAGGTALAELMRASFRVSAWFSVGFALLLALAATPVLTTIYGAKFASAAPALAILVWVIPIMFLSGHARFSMVVAGAQRGVLYGQVAGLATVALVGGPLVLMLAEVGAALAAVAGNMAIWVVSHRLASRLSTPPPSFSFVVRPLLLALVLGAGVALSGLPQSLGALGGFVLYVILAPLVDRVLVADFVKLAHAKAIGGQT